MISDETLSVRNIVRATPNIMRRVLEAYPLIKTKIDLKEIINKGEEKIKKIRNK